VAFFGINYLKTNWLYYFLLHSERRGILFGYDWPNAILMETLFNLFALVALLGSASFVAYLVVGTAAQGRCSTCPRPTNTLPTDLHRRLMAKGR
jgi:hypothetical protein